MILCALNAIFILVNNIVDNKMPWCKIAWSLIHSYRGVLLILLPKRTIVYIQKVARYFMTKVLSVICKVVNLFENR